MDRSHKNGMGKPIPYRYMLRGEPQGRFANRLLMLICFIP